MKTKAQKKEALDTIKDKLDRAKVIIFTSFARAGEKGLNVGGMMQLRRSLRQADAEYSVQKKSLLAKALKDHKQEVDFSGYEGSMGAVFGYSDELATIKSLYGFSKTNAVLKYFGGLVEGKLVDAAYITTLAKLPGRDVLLGQFVGMLNYPIRGLVVALDQIAKQKSNQ